MIRVKDNPPRLEVACEGCGTTFLYDESDVQIGEWGTKGFTCPKCGEWIVVDWDRHLPPTYPVTFSNNNGVPLSDEKINEYVQRVANSFKDMNAGEFSIAGTGDTMVIGLKFEDEEDIYVLKNYWEDEVIKE